MKKTFMAGGATAHDDRKWHVVDAQGKILGRLACRIANLLRGKHKPTFTPHEDAGDFVIVINAAGLQLTGSKSTTKLYHRHTGYPGGLRTRTAKVELVSNPERMLRRAVAGMLPKNRLGRHLATKVKIYRGAEHPHAAQRPSPIGE